MDLEGRRAEGERFNSDEATPWCGGAIASRPCTVVRVAARLGSLQVAIGQLHLVLARFSSACALKALDKDQ